MRFSRILTSVLSAVLLLQLGVATAALKDGASIYNGADVLSLSIQKSSKGGKTTLIGRTTSLKFLKKESMENGDEKKLNAEEESSTKPANSRRQSDFGKVNNSGNFVNLVPTRRGLVEKTFREHVQIRHLCRDLQISVRKRHLSVIRSRKNSP